jgi:hypothetical protein
MSEKKTITAEEFDRIFDEGKEDITQYLDLENIRRPGLAPKRVNVDFPAWMVNAMDREANRIGITRQAFIKVVVAERLGDIGRP